MPAHCPVPPESTQGTFLLGVAGGISTVFDRLASSQLRLASELPGNPAEDARKVSAALRLKDSFLAALP